MIQINEKSIKTLWFISIWLNIIMGMFYGFGYACAVLDGFAKEIFWPQLHILVALTIIACLVSAITSGDYAKANFARYLVLRGIVCFTLLALCIVNLREVATSSL